MAAKLGFRNEEGNRREGSGILFVLVPNKDRVELTSIGCILMQICGDNKF